jgi:hypothetical protein
LIRVNWSLALRNKGPDDVAQEAYGKVNHSILKHHEAGIKTVDLYRKHGDQ